MSDGVRPEGGGDALLGVRVPRQAHHASWH